MNLKKLDEYLNSDASPEDCLLLSDLDYFLTGILFADLIMPSEWLLIVWGTDEPIEPMVKDMDIHSGQSKRSSGDTM